jgi:hypothetical protein
MGRTAGQFLETDTELTFPGVRSLAAWLRGHPNGRKILLEIVDAEIEHGIRADKRIVLVVLTADGLVDVYSDRGVTVIARTLLDGDDSDYSLREAYLTATLPKGVRHIYDPRHHKLIERVRRVTPEDELRAVNRRAELKIIQEMKPIFAELRNRKDDDEIPDL